MMEIDPEELMRTAVTSILDSDTGAEDFTIKSLMGRPADFACEWDALRFNGPLPMIATLLYNWSETPASGEMWSGIVRLSAFANGNDAQYIVAHLLRRAQRLMNWTNFSTYGADAAPVLFRRPGPFGDLDREGSRGLARGDLEFEITLQVAST